MEDLNKVIVGTLLIMFGLNIILDITIEIGMHNRIFALEQRVSALELK